MIFNHEGNLLDLEEGILVHGCNCLGAMGSGIAGQIRKKWPSVYEAYHQVYNDTKLYLGQIIPVASTELPDIRTPGRVSDMAYSEELPAKLIVVNAMTQYHTVSPKLPDEIVVDYDAISAAFAQIKLLARETGLPVHFPLIGCGLANGNWEEVAPRIEAALGDKIEKHLWIYKP